MERMTTTPNSSQQALVLVIDGLRADLRTLYETHPAQRGLSGLNLLATCSKGETCKTTIRAVITDMQLPDGLGLAADRQLNSGPSDAQVTWWAGFKVSGAVPDQTSGPETIPKRWRLRSGQPGDASTAGKTDPQPVDASA
jgi:hypothetical protein